MLRLLKLGDAAVIHRVLAGRREDFGELVHRHLPTVYALALALTGNRADAEDISQESFLKALQFLHTLRDPHKFAPWLVSITRFAAYDVRRARLRETSLDSQPNLAEAAIYPDVEKREMRQLIHEQIHALDSILKEVLLLHYFTGHSTDTIAELLDISPDAVRKRMQRAREALGENMLAHLGEANASEPWLRKREARIVSAVLAAPCPWLTGAPMGTGVPSATTTASCLQLPITKIAAAILIVAAGLGAWHYSDSQHLQFPETALSSLPPKDHRDPPLSRNQTTALAPPTAKPVNAGKLAAALADAAQNRSGGGVIRGNVLYEDGTPASGAAITLWQSYRIKDWAMRRDNTAKTTHADAVGHFEFIGVDDTVVSPFWTEYVVVAHTDAGLAIADASLNSAPQKDNLTLRLERSAPMSGRIVDTNQKGIAGAEVYPRICSQGISICYNQAPALAVVTDSEGKFHFPALWQGDWSFDVRTTGYAAITTDNFTTGTHDNTIHLTRGAAVTGRVIQARTGQPLPNLEVHLYPDRAIETSETLADAAGRFRFADLGTGSFRLGVLDDNWALAEGLVSLSVDSNASICDIQLEATQAAALEGQVVDAETAMGISGIYVCAENKEIPWYSKSKLTDSTGRFRVSGLAPGPYVVWYTHHPDYPACVSHRDPDIAVEAGQVIRDYTITLCSTPSFSGKAIDAHGNPVEGVYVSAVGSPHNSQSCETGKDGVFVLRGFEVESEVVTFCATKPSFATVTLPPVKIPKGGLKDLRLVMEPGATVEGTLLDTEGQPTERLSLELRSTVDPLAIGRTSTDLDGSFVVSGLPAGSYEVWISSPTIPPDFPDSRTGESLSLLPGQHLTDLKLVFEPKIARETSES
ncbi:MAG: sigma-70 family RNA polymerase sigma factor [Candidatus Hydrogenedentales bacterium]|jgi:RNA polymerase sigma-70 factor (ECF subfamily)